MDTTSKNQETVDVLGTIFSWSNSEEINFTKNREDVIFYPLSVISFFLTKKKKNGKRERFDYFMIIHGFLENSFPGSKYHDNFIFL